MLSPRTGYRTCLGPLAIALHHAGATHVRVVAAALALLLLVGVGLLVL